MVLNAVFLFGRLVAAPELKTTPSGVSVLQFTLAVPRKYAKQDDPIKADFINCVAWRNTAEFISAHFKKGSPILISGYLSVRSWEATDNVKRYITEVVISEASFGESKKDADIRQSKSIPLPDIPESMKITNEQGESSGLEDISSDGELPF